MKLKNKLLSIGATLLLSCQYAPAQAKVVDNSLNPVGVELTLCESIAEFAEDVSNLRQNGAKYSDVIAVARWDLSYEAHDLIGETSHKTDKLVIKGIRNE